MSTDHTDPTLRFDAGKYEESVVGLILVLQFTLAAILVMMLVGFVYFTIDAWFDANRSITYFFGAIPYMIGMALAMYLLNYLYE
ncbi:hypothetical protein [Halosolutus halophilus]|uniref:hypothetical protein n=1 Tax=Halosolutus halophilus TaxID=1552990 RepID=UPI00223503AD|nr:hypothetical protein [Halosolutus halophilus]